MSVTRVVGLVLVVFGLIALLWGGVFWKDRDTLVDAGPLQVSTEHQKGVSIPPIAGGVAIVAGIVLLVLPRRQHI
jgi:hypothetical protein